MFQTESVLQQVIANQPHVTVLDTFVLEMTHSGIAKPETLALD